MTPESNNKIKVLHLIACLDIGGAEQLLLTLAKNFNSNQFELIIGCIDAEGELAVELKKTSVKYVCFAEQRFRYGYKKYLNLYRYIKNNKINIVHTHLHRANYIGRLIAFLARVPVIVKSEHGFAGDYCRQKFMKIPRYLWINRLLDGLTDAFIYVSRYQYDLNISNKPYKKMHVIPNAIDQKRFTINESKAQIRKELGFKEDELIVGTVANLIDYKGHRYLLQAAAQIKEKFSKVKFVLVGAGVEYDNLKKLSSELCLENTVIFLGKRKDIPQLLRAFDIYVQPSLFESFGLSIAEAMFSGLPVVASGVGGIPEIIKDGENGLLVDKANYPALAAAILSLLENPEKARTLATKGKGNFLCQYTEEIFAQNILRLYQKMIIQKSLQLKNSIAYFLGSFPGGNPPFIINEIVGLQLQGINIVVFPIHEQFEDKNMFETQFISVIFADPNVFLQVIIAHLFYLFMRSRRYFQLAIRFQEYGGKKVFWEGIYFASLMQKMKIKHIHAHFAWKAADCARLIHDLTGISYSFTAHQSDIHRWPERLLEKIGGAKFVLTCTKGNNEYLVQKYGLDVGGKIFTIYHGVDIKKFSPDASGQNAQKDIDILSIGELKCFKGFSYLIDVFKIISENKMKYKLIIIGSGPEKNMLEETICNYGLTKNVTIINQIAYDDIPNYLRRSKMFVLPTTIIDRAPHGIPNVIAEAMSCEVPVVAFDVPHISELILNGEEGILVPDKDTQAMSKAVELLLLDDELRKKMGINAREKIQTVFDLEKQILLMVDLFKRCCNDKKDN